MDGVGQWLERLERKIDTLHAQLDSDHWVRRDLYEAELRRVNARLDEGEEARQWTTRLLIGSFVLTITVALILAALFGPQG